MQRILAFTGIKGGAGKSTLAVALAVEWHLRGFKVLLVDLDDVQRSSLTWSDLAEEQGRDAPTVVAMGDNLKSQLPRVGAGYDIVILDNAGRLSERSAWAIGLSDLTLMPCGPAGILVAAMAHTFAHVGAVRARRPDLEAAVLLCKRKPNTVIARQARKSFDDAPFPVLETELDERLDYDEAWTAGMGPTNYAPHGAAADEIRALASEIERRWGLKRRKGHLRVAK